MNVSQEDYYKILGINESTTQDEIKKTFRKLSLKHHPDKGGDSNMFKKINEAYQILGDEQKRKQYDHQRKFGTSNNPFSNFDGMGGGHGIPEDILKQMFGGFPGMGGGGFPFSVNMQGVGNNPHIRIFRNGQEFSNVTNRRPTLITQTVTITDKEAYTGCSKPLNIERWIEDSSKSKRVEQETIYVDIPEGIDNNEAILLTGKGNIITETKGDIRIIIKIETTCTTIKREGLNLMYIKKLTLKESLCGFAFSIHHLNGKEYKINNQNTVITPEYRKVVSNLGMKRGNRVGNLFIIFEVEFPLTLTETQIEKLKEIL